MNNLRDKQSCHIHSYNSPLVKIFQENKCTLSDSCFCNTTWKWPTARSSSKSERDPKDQFQAGDRQNTKNSKGPKWGVFLISKSPTAFFLESKIWIVICTRHKILNTCSALFFFLILRQLINLLQSYGIPFRLIYGTQLGFLIAELPSTNQIHHPIKNEFTMGTAHWKLNNGLIFKLKLKYLLFCQLIQNSLWIIALPLLSKCCLFSLKVIVFGETFENNEHYFTYSGL